MDGWKSAKVELPEAGKQVLVLVDSGYIAPYSQSIQTARYETRRNPRNEFWVADSGARLEDSYGNDLLVFWREIPEGWLGKTI